MSKIGRPVNYLGSKERMSATIHSMIPPGMKCWVDVFCGSAIVTLLKPRHPREVINDMNSDITNLFWVLRNGRAHELYAALELTPFAERELYICYELEDTDDPIERARRFLVQSWFGRGGDAHRTGLRWSKGSSVSPELAWARLPERLTAVAERLRGICIRHVDGMKIIDDYDEPYCILFVDPPYPGFVGRRYAVRMTNQEHEALAFRLRSCKASVILTMVPGTIYDGILNDWHCQDSKVVTAGGTKKPEYIFTNFEPLPLLR